MRNDGSQCRIGRPLTIERQGIAQKCVDAGNRDVRLGHPLSQQPGATAHLADSIELREPCVHLSVTALHPRAIALLRRSERRLVYLGHALLRCTDGHGDDVQSFASRIARPRQQSARRIDAFIEEIQDCRGFNQGIPHRLHQARNPSQGIELTDQFKVLAHRPAAVLERYLQKVHAHRHTADEGRIEHADENHQ